MGLSSATGVLTVGTGVIGTTYAVSGLSFQPSLVLFWWTGQPTSVADVISEIDFRLGWGAASSTSARWTAATQSDHGAATSATDRAFRTDACIASLTTAGAIDGLADLQSLDSGGFTLVIDDAFATGLRVSWLALGGSDLTGIHVGSFNSPNATGSFDVTTLSFQPEALLIVSTGSNLTPTTQGALSIGAATAASQFCYAGTSRDSAGTASTRAYARSTNLFSAYSHAGTPPTIVDLASLSSFLSNGFRLSYAAATTATVLFVALRGAQFKVGSFVTQTDTTTPMAQAGFGFSPSAALLVSACRAESSAGTATADNEISVGAFTSTSSRNAQSVNDQDTPTTMDIGVALEHDCIYANISNAATKAIEGLMDVQSVDSGGFTAIMTDADPTANFVWYLAFGPAAAPLPFNSHAMMHHMQIAGGLA